MNGDATRARPLGMSSGSKMKETYGVRKKSRGNGQSGHRMREVYAKTKRDDRRSSGHEQLMELTNLHVSNGQTVLGCHRKDSTNSTDSNDSDYQLLCTEDRCIMDASASSKQARNEVRQRPITKEGARGQTSLAVTSTGKLCNSCRGETMQGSRPSRRLAVDERTEGKTFYSRTRALRRSISDIMPKWLSEPEYMMHAKPRMSKDQ